MKLFDKTKDFIIQGDMAIIRVSELPADAKQSESKNGMHVLAHSETGHNHVIADNHTTRYDVAANDLVSFVVVKDRPADVTHLRSFDTHETIRLDPGIYRINRQREYTPEGYRRVAD